MKEFERTLQEETESFQTQLQVRRGFVQFLGTGELTSVPEPFVEVTGIGQFERPSSKDSALVALVSASLVWQSRSLQETAGAGGSCAQTWGVFDVR